MKTKEELNVLKEEIENMNKRLDGLSKDELKEVVGGGLISDTEDQSFEMSSGETVDKFLPGTIDYAN